MRIPDAASFAHGHAHRYRYASADADPLALHGLAVTSILRDRVLAYPNLPKPDSRKSPVAAGPSPSKPASIPK